MSIIGALLEKYMESQSDIDARRREDNLYHFQQATIKKNKKSLWSPTNVGYLSHRLHPNIAIDNWSAAWKVRRHWEEQTELRKMNGKTIY